MPIVGLVSNGIMSASASKTEAMTGIALGVESGLYSWLSQTRVLGVGSGVLGSGVLGGTLTVTPNGALMESAFKGNGLVGDLSSSLWVSIMLGISKPYVFTGVSPIVGSGVFVGSFVGEPSLLVSSLESSFGSQGMVGSSVFDLSSAIGQGIYGHFLEGKIVGGIVGPVGPSPSSSSLSGSFV